MQKAGSSTIPSTTPLKTGTTLTLNEVGKCNTAAQLDGTLYGTAAGFLGGTFSFRFLKLNKNISLLSGLLTGVISGYVVSKQALQTRIARKEADKLEQQEKRKASVASDLDRFEGSQTPGLEEFRDSYATTSGEH